MFKWITKLIVIQIAVFDYCFVLFFIIQSTNGNEMYQ